VLLLALGRLLLGQSEQQATRNTNLKSINKLDNPFQTIISQMSCESATDSNQVVAHRPVDRCSAKERNRLTKQEPTQGKKKHWWSRQGKRSVSFGYDDSANFADGDCQSETKSATTSRSSISSTDSITCVRARSFTETDRRKLGKKEKEAQKLQKRRERHAYEEYIEAAAIAPIFF